MIKIRNYFQNTNWSERKGSYDSHSNCLYCDRTWGATLMCHSCLVHFVASWCRKAVSHLAAVSYAVRSAFFEPTL